MSTSKSKKVTALLLIPIALAIGIVAFYISNESDVHFMDENLELAVREALDKKKGTLRREDLQQIDSLDLSHRGIESLEGLEDFVTLRDLNLEGNRIDNIEPLADLVYLEHLNLRDNPIKKVDALQPLKRMQTLDIRDTRIKDVEPLSELVLLTDLNIRGNRIESLQPLANMEQLRVLNARNNNIKNINVLRKLTKLEDVNLRNNRIEDFSPILSLPHLHKRLYVTGNPGVDLEDFVPLYDQIEKMDIDAPDLAVVFNKKGGQYESPQTIQLRQLIGAEGTIRYTLDGSEPSEESREYTKPITVKKPTVIKAKFFDRYGNPGQTKGNTYVIGEKSTIPVVSISADPEHFFNEATGIYAQGSQYDESAETPEETANYAQSGDFWEREASVEIYAPDGTNMIHQQAGVRVHGNTSRYYPKKSFRLYARSDYSSENTFSYPLFPGEEENEYNRLLIRNSGNDWDETLFRDAFLQELLTGFDVEKQAFRPVNLYLNGKYWGVYNLRERIDKHYFEFKYGVKEENLEYLENNASVRVGDNRHYQKMLDYIEHNDITDPQVYAQVTEQMDMKNFIDYNIAEIYTRNLDWPANNNRYWREKPNGKWRWTIFDLDFGFGLKGVDETVAHHTLDFATAEGGQSWPNPDWATYLLRTLLKNEEFQAQFMGTFSHYLNTNFNEKRVTELLDEFEAMYEPEMAQNIKRWGEPESLEKWKKNIDVMRKFGKVRDDYMYAHLVDYFGLSGLTELTFSVEDGHRVQVYGEDVPVKDGTWTGTYTADTPLEVRVDGKPAILESASKKVDIKRQNRFSVSETGDAEITISDNSGEAIGTIQAVGIPIPKDTIRLRTGEKLNWTKKVSKEGAYASISNPALGKIEKGTFTAEKAGEGLLTIHNKKDEVIAMARLHLIDPATEPRVYNDGHPAAQYAGTWEESANDRHFEGTASFSETAGDTITISFEGTGIHWYGYTGPTQGIAAVEIDGKQTEVDTFSEEAAFHKDIFTADGLTDEEHTLTITVTGKKNEKSLGERIHLDSFEVLKE
ncbi:CotH kinase family protein [Bacillus piscicola]|uniref:CotH kinase family protein n=1 Tax=Bacillus piscicola TaxID=1632684 RepID=UPI001F092FED|nr:CotH kinase family protein [Bacillus piscicola]